MERTCDLAMFCKKRWRVWKLFVSGVAARACPSTCMHPTAHPRTIVTATNHVKWREGEREQQRECFCSTLNDALCRGI